MYKAKPKPQRQFEIVDRDQIRFAVILGPEEVKAGKVRIKEQLGKEVNADAQDKSGLVVDRQEMVDWLLRRLKDNVWMMIRKALKKNKKTIFLPMFPVFIKL